jgi:hypothetical protein
MSAWQPCLLNEVMHPALQHYTRRGDRFRGMSAERIYNLIEAEENQESEQQNREADQAQRKIRRLRAITVQTSPSRLLLRAELGRYSMPRRLWEKRRRQFPSGPVNGRSPSSRQRAWRSWPGSCPEARCECLNQRTLPEWTGARSSGGPGPKPPPPTMSTPAWLHRPVER